MDVYDFAPYATIVDVGGGEGGFLTAILANQPDATGILFDLPDVIDDARNRLAGTGLASRCDLVAGNFFDHVPSGGDIYLLKWVLHNWNDDQSIAILKNCRNAMTDDATLLIVDAVIPPAMAEITRLESRAVIGAYDFAGARRVIDVGGGDGTLLAAILHACPGATGVLFDQPHIAETARQRMGASGLHGRWEVTSGDLFGEIPPGGDVYVLKWILHDWSDAQAIAILRSCRRAMASESRLILIERLVPPGDTPHPSKALDLVMLILLGGRERTKDGYAELLAKAGFQLGRVIDTKSTMSIIEAHPQRR